MPQDLAKKLLTLKQSRKPHIYFIRCLMVNSQVKNLRLVSEEDPFAIFWFFITFQWKKILKKSVSWSNFSFINR